MHRLCILALVLGYAASDPVEFKDCGSKTGVLKAVDISGCKKFPCPLKRGTNVLVSADFTSNVDTKKLTAVVHGTIAGIPIPFPIPNADGCKSNIKCPVSKGAKNLYKTQIAVSHSYPKVKVLVKWELRDDNGSDEFCFVVPAEITD